MTLDVEKDLADLFQLEIKLHRRSERVKQELAASKGFSGVACYNAIDDYSIGHIY